MSAKHSPSRLIREITVALLKWVTTIESFQKGPCNELNVVSPLANSTAKPEDARYRAVRLSDSARAQSWHGTVNGLYRAHACFDISMPTSSLLDYSDA